MQIKDYTYYHGTSRTNAALIMKNGFYQPPLVSKTDIIERNIKTSIGSLGIGVYAFCAIKEHALLFAHRKIKLEPAIISFKILNDDYILNFTIPQTLRIYNEFLLSAYRTIQELKPKYSNKGYSKSLDGAIIETFMQFLMQENYVTHIQGVYKTSINNFGNYLNYSWIPNSIELCLKDTSLINHATIQLA
jgi:hypothetical protein